MKLFATVVLAAMVNALAAQNINNLNATLKDGLVVITYDLQSENPKQSYNVEVFSSHDAYRNALKFTTGDVGNNISGGDRKQILWSVAKAMGTFQGQVSFKVKAEVLPLPFEFKNPVQGESVRRGKTSNIEWEGGNPTQNVIIEVYRGSERLSSFESKNTGHYDWMVPQDFSKGEGYQLRIVSGQPISSGTFSVKAKIPLLLKLSPLLIGAAVIPFLGGSGGGEPTSPVSEQLAAAPNPN